MSKTRASTSEQARKYRQEGHDNATIFALLIGLDTEYQNDKKAKKDVIDPSGDARAVKSGAKKWKIFLYGRSRHYQEVRFNMYKDKALEMLYKFIPDKHAFSSEILVYGNAIEKFGNWR